MDEAAGWTRRLWLVQRRDRRAAQHSDARLQGVVGCTALDAASLASHGDAIVAGLEDPCTRARCGVGCAMLDAASLALHCGAIVARLKDSMQACALGR